VKNHAKYQQKDRAGNVPKATNNRFTSTCTTDLYVYFSARLSDLFFKHLHTVT